MNRSDRERLFRQRLFLGDMEKFCLSEVDKGKISGEDAKALFRL
jgi:hypothetical protein